MCSCTFIHKNRHTHAHTRFQINTHAHLYIHIFEDRFYVNVSVCICMFFFIFIYICIYFYIYLYIYLYLCVFMRVCTHVRAAISVQPSSYSTLSQDSHCHSALSSELTSCLHTPTCLSPLTLFLESFLLLSLRKPCLPAIIFCRDGICYSLP